MSQKNHIYNVDGQSISAYTMVNVAQNEPLINQTMNRSLIELWENDNVALYELNKAIFNQLNIVEYTKGMSYSVGDLVWYKDANSKTYLLKCIRQNNTTQPNTTGIDEDFSLNNSGWKNQNKQLSILDYSIMNVISANAQNVVKQHQDNELMHPYGKISLDSESVDNISNKLLKSDLSNIDRNRKSVFFPQYMKKLDAGNAIVTGYSRNFGSIVEYDIILKLANADMHDSSGLFDAGQELTSNNATFALFSGTSQSNIDYQQNKNYFYSTADMDMFGQSGKYSSRIGLIVQLDRNDFVNTYSAKISFSKPFSNLNYMVFSNAILSQTIGSNTMVPSANDIVYCDKTRESITFLDITFPDSTKYGQSGYNATNGGLTTNSFHMKVIGEIDWSII